MKKKNIKKRYTPEFRTHIRELCRELKTLFLVGEYMMNLCWCDGTEDEEKNGVAASIDYDSKYLNFKIHILPLIFKMWEKRDDELIARCLVHEFCHLIIGPAYDFGITGASKERYDIGRDIMERQTQRMANVIFDRLQPKLWLRHKK